MFTQSGVVGGSSCRLIAAYVRATSDHVWECSAPSPARYLASSSAMAASIWSGSNVTRARILSSVSISMMQRASEWNASGRWSSTHEAVSTQRKTLPTGCDGGGRHFSDSEVGCRPHACDLDIPAASDAGVHHAATIIDAHFVGQHSRHHVEVACCKGNLEAVVYPARRILQLRRRAGEVVEPPERGVEVCFVE